MSRFDTAREKNREITMSGIWNVYRIPIGTSKNPTGKVQDHK